MRGLLPKLHVSMFWYLVVLAAGLYWGIGFFSGGVRRTYVVVFPPAICLGTATFATGRLGKRALLGAISLYVTFLFSFSAGYRLARDGAIRFVYRTPVRSAR